MRCSTLYLSVSVVLLYLAGCQESPKKPSDGQGPVVSGQDERAMKVVIEGGAEFPHGLVGRWRARAQGWEFIFEPDGKISSAVISLGRVRVTPGQTATVPTRTGDEGIFKPGQWTVHYVPAGKALTVTIVMEKIKVQMGANILEGNSTDVFVGQVDENADVCQAEWTTFPKYTAHTPERPDFKLAVDETYGIATLVTFERVPGQ